MLLLGLLALLLLTFGLARGQETKETETKKPWTGRLAEAGRLPRLNWTGFSKPMPYGCKVMAKRGKKAELVQVASQSKKSQSWFMPI